MIIDFSIPEEIRKAIVALSNDDDFDKIYNEDEELNNLFDRTINYEIETQLLQLNATGGVKIGRYEVLGYSPIAINLLWLLRSPVLFDLNNAKVRRYRACYLAFI